MSSVVYLGEVLEVKVRVDLGRRDVRMTQQLLDATQIVARFQKMRGKGMADFMRGDPAWVNLCLYRYGFEQLGKLLPRHSPTIRGC